jgi:hypothetical protein
VVFLHSLPFSPHLFSTFKWLGNGPVLDASSPMVYRTITDRINVLYHDIPTSGTAIVPIIGNWFSFFYHFP